MIYYFFLITNSWKSSSVKHVLTIHKALCSSLSTDTYTPRSTRVHTYTQTCMHTHVHRHTQTHTHWPTIFARRNALVDYFCSAHVFFFVQHRECSFSNYLGALQDFKSISKHVQMLSLGGGTPCPHCCSPHPQVTNTLSDGPRKILCQLGDLNIQNQGRKFGKWQSMFGLVGLSSRLRDSG